MCHKIGLALLYEYNLKNQVVYNLEYFLHGLVLTALFYYHGRVTKLRNATINGLRTINFNRAEIYGQFVETFTADEQKSLFFVPLFSGV